MTEADVDIIRQWMKDNGLYHHEGYSGPSDGSITVALLDDRFLLVGADKDQEWHDSVDSVIDYLRKHSGR